MSSQHSETQRSGWKLILTGLLAFAFGIAAIVLPGNIMFRRIFDVVFGSAKPMSGGMTAVAALLALVAVAAIDGLLNLFGAGVMARHGARLRGVAGIVAALAAIFWPGITAYVAVELLGLWAILIGVLELIFAKDSSAGGKDHALLIIAGIAAIVIGAGMMRWVVAGAVAVSAVIGVAAAVRGVTLIASGIYARTSQRSVKREREAPRSAA